jgi:hypothetical protein
MPIEQSTQIYMVQLTERDPISEMIFKMKNTFQNLINSNVQCFYHEPHLIKLVP